MQGKGLLTIPDLMLLATGNGAHVVLSSNLWWREQKWMRKSKKATKLPNYMLEQRKRQKIRVNVKAYQDIGSAIGSVVVPRLCYRFCGTVSTLL